MVGASKTSTNTYAHAFIWDIGTGMQDLGTFGYRSTSAYDINDSGQVVGVGSENPFLWTVADGYTPLYNPYTNTSANAYSINNSGQVAGGIGLNAYLWNTPTELEQYPMVEKLVAINDSGQAVGIYTTTTVNYVTSDSVFF